MQKLILMIKLCFFRRVLIFPKGNNVDYLSMYLDVADSAILQHGWVRYAQFSLAVINQIQSNYTIRKGITAFFFFPSSLLAY